METNQQNQDEIEIDLLELLRVLWSKIGYVILAALALGLLMVLVSKVFMKPQYESTTKTFLANLGNDISDFDLVSIHQANKMIIDNVAKRIKAPQEKVINSIERFGNTRGASTAVNICDYAENNNIYEGDKKILALAFGIGLNVTVASFTIDMSVCLPIIKTSEVYDDGIDSETYFK